MALGELVSAAFKNMSMVDIVQLIQVQNLKGLYQRVLGGGKPPANTTPDDGTKEAKDDGRGMIDELNALVAMAEAHFGKDLESMSDQENSYSRTRHSKLVAIFKLLREKNLVGGAEKLMHIIGHESHLQGTASTPRVVQGQKPDGQPVRIDIHNVRQRTNPAGKLIIRFLTDLDPQEAVDLLTATSITDTGKDKTAAALKATADKSKEVWQQIRDWWFDGGRDMRFHSAWAKFILNDDAAMKRILSSQGALELWDKIQQHADDPVKQRPHYEALQKYIWDMVDELQAPAKARAREQQHGNKPARQLPWMAIIYGSLGALVLLIIISSQLKSLGT